MIQAERVTEPAVAPPDPDAHLAQARQLHTGGASSGAPTTSTPTAGALAANADGAPCAVTLVAHNVGTIGGMERQLAELAVGLRRLDCEVTIIARTCELPDDAGVVFRRVRGPSRPFLLAYPWFLLSGSLAVRRWRNGLVQATGAIVLNRVDIIAVHCCHQIGITMTGRPGRLFGLYAWLVGVVKRMVERLCFRINREAAVICVSHGVADEVRMHFPQMVGPIITIHNGVDTDLFRPGVHEERAAVVRASLGMPDDRLVVAFVGGQWELKGLRAVIGALSSAPGWDLVVAGRGDPKVYQPFADSLGVGPSVHWLGVVRDVQDVYTLADAFVLPSRYETFSLVTFEAAASGLPVLATPVSGVRELIEDGVNGFLITPDAGAIADRLVRLAADPELRVRLGKAARESTLAYRWDVMVSKHEELYRQLAGREGAASARG